MAAVKIESKVFPWCAVEVRLTRNGDSETPIVLVIDTGACRLQTYPNAAELRALAAMFTSIADGVEVTA